MHIGILRRTAFAVALLAALLAAADARASSYYEASPAGPITAATGALRFSTALFETECEVTLTGSIPQGTLEGTAGARIGGITSAAIPRCNSGTVTATPGLPWSLDYEGALGVLPLITGLRLRLNRLAVAFTIFGIRCEYSGVVPLLLALTGSGPFQTGALSVVSGAQLQRVAGSSLCPTSGTLGGTFSFTRQVVQANPVWVVAMGDSFISGEAGRWAGNTALESQRIDALGPTAYFDNPAGNAEIINRCHRSRAAEIIIGVANYASFACSGAKTFSFWAPDPILPLISYQKPGMDWANNGIPGQVGNLRLWLEVHQRGVRMIVISIGGNDFNFAPIVRQCLADFLTPVPPGPRFCSQRPEVLANFTVANQTAVRERIKQAILNVHQVLLEKNLLNTRILVQNYPSPLPEEGGRFRYPETYARQTTGGCGVYNVDAAWANNVVLATINANVNAAITAANLGNTVQLLDVSSAFMGRRLCERGVWLLEELGLTSWNQNQQFAADWTEWINQIRTLETAIGPYYLQEGLHPNYWGQLALRNCVRLAYNNGNIRGGTCSIAAPGLNNANPREPNMRLQ
jgi:hypothetical protein